MGQRAEGALSRKETESRGEEQSWRNAPEGFVRLVGVGTLKADEASLRWQWAITVVMLQPKFSPADGSQEAR